MPEEDRAGVADLRQQIARARRPRARGAPARCGWRSRRLRRGRARGSARRAGAATRAMIFARGIVGSSCRRCWPRPRRAGRVRRKQDRLRHLVVLGLREQIHRDPVRIGAAVGDHQDLRRAGDHVDADRAEHAPLGRGDVGVAGADDLVDLRDRRRAVGERRDRLRAADREARGRRRRAPRRRAPARCFRRRASGTTMTISRTPATLAGSAFISTDDGYAALPPGT